MPSSLPCKRGDGVLVLFPNSDLRTAKRRPALVVQANGLANDLPQTIVAKISSRMFRANHPSRLTILSNSAEGRQSGLLSDSVVMTDNLATVSDPVISEIIGNLPMTEVDRGLRHTPNLQT